MADDLQPVSAEDWETQGETVFDSSTNESQENPFTVSLQDDGEIAPTTAYENMPFDSEKKSGARAWWDTLRITFFPTAQERREQAMRRIQRLSHSIQINPESGTNYVLRGELYLDIGDILQAAEDFRRGLELIAIQVEQEEWGIIAQVMRDRAQQGLAEVMRYTL